MSPAGTSTTRLRFPDGVARRATLVEVAERAGAARRQRCDPEPVGTDRSQRPQRQLPTQWWPRCRPPRVARPWRASRLLRASGQARRTQESAPASPSPATPELPPHRLALARCGSSGPAHGAGQLSRHDAVLVANLSVSGEPIGARHADAGSERLCPSAASPNLREGSPHPRILP